MQQSDPSVNVVPPNTNRSKNKQILIVGVLIVVLVLLFIGVLLRNRFLSNSGTANDASAPRQLVAGFPEFPIDPLANLETSAKDDEGPGVYTAMWYSQESPMDIVDFYEDTLYENGWNLLETPQEYTDTWEADYTIKAERNGQTAELRVVSEDDDDDTKIYLKMY